MCPRYQEGCHEPMLIVCVIAGEGESVYVHAGGIGRLRPNSPIESELTQADSIPDNRSM